jgi:hypothetical protein
MLVAYAGAGAIVALRALRGAGGRRRRDKQQNADADAADAAQQHRRRAPTPPLRALIASAGGVELNDDEDDDDSSVDPEDSNTSSLLAAVASASRRATAEAVRACAAGGGAVALCLRDGRGRALVARESGAGNKSYDLVPVDTVSWSRMLAVQQQQDGASASSALPPVLHQRSDAVFLLEAAVNGDKNHARLFTLRSLGAQGRLLQASKANGGAVTAAAAFGRCDEEEHQQQRLPNHMLWRVEVKEDRGRNNSNHAPRISIASARWPRAPLVVGAATTTDPGNDGANNNTNLTTIVTPVALRACAADDLAALALDLSRRLRECQQTTLVETQRADGAERAAQRERSRALAQRRAAEDEVRALKAQVEDAQKMATLATLRTKQANERSLRAEARMGQVCGEAAAMVRRASALEARLVEVATGSSLQCGGDDEEGWEDARGGEEDDRGASSSSEGGGEGALLPSPAASAPLPPTASRSTQHHNHHHQHQLMRMSAPDVIGEARFPGSWQGVGNRSRLGLQQQRAGNGGGNNANAWASAEYCDELMSACSNLDEQLRREEEAVEEEAAWERRDDDDEEAAYDACGEEEEYYEDYNELQYHQEHHEHLATIQEQQQQLQQQQGDNDDDGANDANAATTAPIPLDASIGAPPPPLPAMSPVKPGGWAAKTGRDAGGLLGSASGSALAGNGRAERRRLALAAATAAAAAATTGAAAPPPPQHQRRGTDDNTAAREHDQHGQQQGTAPSAFRFSVADAVAAMAAEATSPKAAAVLMACVTEPVTAQHVLR